MGRRWRARRYLLLGALAALVLAAVFPSGGRAQQSPDGIWGLPARAYYPAHTQVESIYPTDNLLDTILGPFHKHTYEQLGRLEGRGWLQIGTLVKRTVQHGKKRSHKLLWLYGVSYYPSPADAGAAFDDLVSRLPPAHGLPVKGVLLKTKGGGYYFTLGVFTAGGIVVEQFCAVPGKDARKYGPLLDRNCGKQRAFLVQILAQVAASTPSPSPTAATTPSPTASPQSSATAGTGERVAVRLIPAAVSAVAARAP